MKNFMRKRIFELAAITVLVVGLLTAAVAYGLKRKANHAHAGEVQQHFGFTLYETQTVTVNGQKPWVSRQRIRAVSADGKIKTVDTTFSQDGKQLGTETSYSIPFVGYLGVDDNRKVLMFISPKDHQYHNPTMEEARLYQCYTRDDVVLGYQVYVCQFPIGGSGRTIAEDYCAPALQDQTLKEVYAGSWGNDTIAVTRIDFSEPDPTLFELPNYPIDYSGWQQKVARARAKGDVKTADMLEEILRKYQASNAKLHPNYVPPTESKSAGSD
jgi:hypothetical protein